MKSNVRIGSRSAQRSETIFTLNRLGIISIRDCPISCRTPLDLQTADIQQECKASSENSLRVFYFELRNAISNRAVILSGAKNPVT